MGGGVPVAWLAPEGARESTPGDDARRELAAWASARGVELTAAHTDEPPTAPDWSAVETVERELAYVRDALAGLEFDPAERALARAEAALRDHPDLPQAAWLRAEVERAWSDRWLRGGDEERAKQAWQRAAGLDGGRAPGLGEKSFEAAAPMAAEIRLEGAASAAGGRALRLDGVIIAAGEVRRTEGEHALAIVERDGRVIWAEWVSLGRGAVVRVEAPAARPCSQGDLAQARSVGEGVRAQGVRCPAWVAAADANGSLRIATCEAHACAPFVEWRPLAVGPPVLGSSATPRADTAPAPHRRWPAWATWTLVGVGVAGAAIGIAAAAGAFRSSPASDTEFVSGGGIVVH